MLWICESVGDRQIDRYELGTKPSIATFHVGAGGQLDSNVSCSFQRQKERERDSARDRERERVSVNQGRDMANSMSRNPRKKERKRVRERKKEGQLYDEWNRGYIVQN